MTKGRLAKQGFSLLNNMGIIFEKSVLNSRKLTLIDTSNRYMVILVKGFDVATYVEKGVADLGVVGKDCLMEMHADVYELVDLNFGHCKMCVCGVKGTKIANDKTLIVASKYPQIASAYFKNRGIVTEIIKLNGSVEIAPLVGLAHVIVDIVETGKTLEDNRLEVLSVITPLSARLIANKVSLKTKSQIMTTLIPSFESKT